MVVFYFFNSSIPNIFVSKILLCYGGKELFTSSCKKYFEKFFDIAKDKHLQFQIINIVEDNMFHVYPLLPFMDRHTKYVTHRVIHFMLNDLIDLID